MALPSLLEVVLLQGLVLLAFGLAGGWLAERLGGPRMAGGVLAGLLLGPTVLGQAAPDVHRYLFVGGYEEHQRIEGFEAEREADRRALEATGVTPVALEEFDRRVEARRAALEAGVDRAEAPHREALAWIAVLAVVFPLMALVYAAPMRGDRTTLFGPAGMALASLLSAGAVGACLGWLLLRFGWLDPAPIEPTHWLAGLGIGCAAASVPFAGRVLDRLHSPHDAQRCGLFSGMYAVFLMHVTIVAAMTERLVSHTFTPPSGIPVLWGVMLWTLLVLGLNAFVHRGRRYLRPMQWARQPMVVGLVGLLLLGFLYVSYQLLGLLSGLAIGAILAGGLLQNLKSTPIPPAWPVAFELLLFALIGSQIDLLADFDWLLVLVVLVAFGDAKALGVMLAVRLFGRRGWMEGLKMGIALAAGGTAPLVVALILRMSGMIDGPLFTALVIAAVTAALLADPAVRMVDEFAEGKPEGRNI